MTRPISTRAHGIIDYMYAATLLALPMLLKWDRRASRLALGVGVATLGVSAMTKYEFGIVPLLPMKTHLAMDAAEASTLMSARRILGHDNAAVRILGVLGLVGAAVGAMTQTISPLERRELPA